MYSQKVKFKTIFEIMFRFGKNIEIYSEKLCFSDKNVMDLKYKSN